MRRNTFKILSFLAATVLCWSMDITGYARPADTLDGRTYAAESMRVSPAALDNDRKVMDVIPATSGGKIGNVGATIRDSTRQAIEDAVAEYTGTGHSVSFVLMDLETGRTLYYNTALSVYSASCIKGPYMVACLAAGNDATNDMYLAGHYSDNDAYGRIRRMYGKDVFAQWLRSIGVDSSLAQWNYCYLTSLDLTRMWLAMYPYIVGDEPGSASARQILHGSLNSVIEAGPGATRTVYSKAGWIAPDTKASLHSYNVGGIVMDEYPYIAVITSDVPGETWEAQALINLLDIAHEEMVMDLTTVATKDAAAAAETQTQQEPTVNLLTDPIPGYQQATQTQTLLHSFNAGFGSDEDSPH